MLKKISLAVTAALFSTCAVASTMNDWSVTGMPAPLLTTVSQDVGGLTGNGQALARSIVATLRAEGYAGAHATLYPVEHQIVVTLGPTGRKGKYAAYLPSGVPSTSSLNTALPLAEAAAEADNQNLHIKIGQNTINAYGTPSNSALGFGGVTLTSYGSRFAGSDTASAFGYGHYDGFDVSGSVTAGLPSWTPKQAMGGNYLSENLDLSMPSQYGIFSWKTTHTHFLAGGQAAPLDLYGNIWQTAIQDKYPLSPNLWVRGGLAYSLDKNTLGALDWSTDQSNTSVYGGVTSRGVIPAIGGQYHIRASVWQGVGGHQYGKGPSVMGNMSSTYTVGRIRVGLRKLVKIDSFPIYTHAILGVQYGSTGTPQLEQAYIGGQHRGSSFYTGAYAGNSGLWYDVNARTKYYQVPKTDGLFKVSPYASFNGGEVQQDGITTHVAATGVGLNMKLTRHMYAQVGYNWTLQKPAGSNQSGLLGFDIVGTY